MASTGNPAPGHAGIVESSDGESECESGASESESEYEDGVEEGERKQEVAAAIAERVVPQRIAQRGLSRPRTAPEQKRPVKPFWLSRSRGGHDHERATGGEAGKAWSVNEDGIVLEAVEQLPRAKRRVGVPLASWALLAPRLPGRTPMAIMRRYRRLMRTEAERPVVREVDLTRTWPRQPAGWVDSKLWPGASAEGWTVYVGGGRYVWEDGRSGDRYTNRGDVLAAHAAEMRPAMQAAVTSATPASDRPRAAQDPQRPRGAHSDDSRGGSGAGDGGLGDGGPGERCATEGGSGDGAAGELMPPPVLSEWEGCPLVPSSIAYPSNTGYQGVSFIRTPGLTRPFHVNTHGHGHGRADVGDFVTALEGALAYSKHLGTEAAAAEAARVRADNARREQMRPEMAEALAAAEGLKLVRDPRTKFGFTGVKKAARCKGLPYLAFGSRGGRLMPLGRFSTAAEAALAYARFLGSDESRRKAQRKLELCEVGYLERKRRGEYRSEPKE